jgi:hypothetical protein
VIQQRLSHLLVMLQVYTWLSGMYEGEVLNGLRHGCGRLTLADSGVIYEGQWRQGKRHGRGVLSYNSDRTAYYEGEQLLAIASTAASRSKLKAATPWRPCSGVQTAVPHTAGLPSAAAAAVETAMQMPNGLYWGNARLDVILLAEAWRHATKHNASHACNDTTVCRRVGR